MISILFDSKAEINFMNDKIRQTLQLKMYFTVDEMTIWSGISHVMNLIKVCSHLKIKIDELKIYHHVFIVRNDIFFLILRQFFLTAIFFNYDYRENGVYAIIFNADLTQSIIFKILDRDDRCNKD